MLPDTRTTATTMPPLIGADDLAGRLGPGTVVLDLRSADAVRAGHLPGTVRSDYAADGWREGRNGVPGYLPGDEALSGLLGRLGIGPDKAVAIVPPGPTAGDFSIAARVYWTLKAAGHPSVSILDGGFPAWAARDGQEGATETGDPAPAPAGPYPVSRVDEVRAELGAVERAVADASAALVDSRGPDSFAGREKSPHAARAGRLPGSLNLDGARAFDGASGRLRGRAELERLFGAVPDGPSIAFCNTGQAAATDWFVLSEILGRPGVRLYDGSMSEWTADPSRPVETG